MYAVYHGPEGLKTIARRVRLAALTLAEGLRRAGLEVAGAPFFDTVVAKAGETPARSIAAAAAAGYNLRRLDDRRVGIALDETVTTGDLVAPAAGLRRLLGQRHLRPCFGRNPGRSDRPGAARRARPRHRVPHPSGFPPLPHRARDAPLPQPDAGQGPLADLLDDLARLLHHEAERHRRDDPGDLAGDRRAASLRPGRPDRGLPRDVPAARKLAGRDQRLRRGQPAAQCRRPGRIRRPDGDPRPPPGARRRPPQDLPDSGLRPRHQPGLGGDGRLRGGGGRLRRAGQRRPRRPAREGRQTRRQPGRAS